MLPEKWKNWEIVDEIGSGSYGTVYEIASGEESLAVKIIEIPQKGEYPLIMKEHKEDAAAYCRSIAQDFETEIHTLTLLDDCENIIHIHDYVVEEKEDGIGWTIYIFMDCLTPFPEYTMTKDLKEADVIKLGLQITNAIVSCNQAGVIHRDIKPENILVTEEEDFLLCDFGLARKMRFKEAYSVKGTYKYMAPEVFRGKEYDFTVDIYSLGLILYQFMNQRRNVYIPLDKDAISHEDEEKAFSSRLNNDPLAPPCDASEEFADIILRMVAFDPKERYQSAEALLKDLTLLQEGKYKKKIPFSFYHYRRQIAAISVILLGIAGYFLYGQMPVYKDKTVNNITSTLKNNGTLTISGEGSIEANDPWYHHKNKIRKIIFKEGITKIDPYYNGLFAECIHLKSVEFPDSLTTIGRDAFYGCRNLRTINHPRNLTFCGTDAFDETKVEKSLTDENGFVSINHILMGYEGESPKVVIPEGTLKISDELFGGRPEIKEVVLPESLTYLGEGAFAGCENLEKVHFGDHIEKIGSRPFEDTKWEKPWAVYKDTLIGYGGEETNPKIPSNIKIIGTGAFASNLCIEDITIPESVERVDAMAFYGCTSLKKVRIKAKLTDIKTSTFEMCTALTEVTLPDTIETLYPMCFKDCDRLKEIVLPKGVKLLRDDPEYDLEDVEPFYKSPTKIIYQ